MKSPLKKILLIALLFNYFSCSSNLDFDQVQVIETTPVFNVSLGYFNITSDGFKTISSVPLTTLSNDIEYRIFENQLLKNNIEKQEYIIDIANSFNRAFEVEIGFLDIKGNNTYKPHSFTVEALDTNFKEIISIDNIDAENSSVKNTTTLRLNIGFKDKTTPFDITSAGAFNFKSSTTLYLRTSINNQE